MKKLMLPLLLLAAAGLTAGEKPDPTDTLQELVTQLVELRTETARERNRWKEEKSHLETSKALLEKENKKLDDELATTKAQTDVAESRREKLAHDIDTSSTLLKRADWSARQTAEQLFASYDALPEPLRVPLAAGATRVRNSLTAKKESQNAADRFRLVAAFASDINRTLSSVHVVKQALAPDGRERREMDVLYLGGAIGYYVSPDGAQAGIVTRNGKEWKCLPRNDLARTVSRSIAVFRKEKPARLVRLPLVQEAKKP